MVVTKIVLKSTLDRRHWDNYDSCAEFFTGLHDYRPSRRAWGIVSGIVSMVIGGLILWSSRDITAWALGLLVGLDLLMTGIALTAPIAHSEETREAIINECLCALNG